MTEAGSRSRARVGDRPDEIRDAAIGLFDERGYHGTRMQDIATALGLQASSLYNHWSSKQDILRDVMLGQMRHLLSEHAIAVTSTPDVAEQLRRSMEAHVRYHARFRREARIGNTEIPSLEEPARSELLAMRRDYSAGWQAVIESGVELGRFTVDSPLLSAYALLQMGVGVAMWFRPPAVPESQLAYSFGEMALRIVQATPAGPHQTTT